jgi:hypothetical protein
MYMGRKTFESKKIWDDDIYPYYQGLKLQLDKQVVLKSDIMEKQKVILIALVVNAFPSHFQWLRILRQPLLMT